MLLATDDVIAGQRSDGGWSVGDRTRTVGPSIPPAMYAFSHRPDVLSTSRRDAVLKR
jgi:hypothetical protein